MQLAVVVFLHTARSHAQSHPAFEAASIKPHPLNAVRTAADAPKTVIDPGMLSMSVISAGRLISFAYDLKSSVQIEGNKPLWLNREYYDVVAKTSSPASAEQLRLMMQGLLADRFHLVCHRETRDGQIYALVAGKNLKLKPASGQEPSEVNPHPVHTSRGDEAIFTYTEKSVSMAQVADWLWSRFGRPVVNATGLQGTFSFTLSVTADQAMGTEDFIYAVQQQLGLKVENRRGPIELLVIDGIERASEN
jgi:uncharacterized protein (TIGR03435 family)